MIHSWFTVNKYWLGTWKAVWSRKKNQSRRSKGCVYLGAMRKGCDLRSKVKAFRFYLNIVKKVTFLNSQICISHWVEMNRLEVGKTSIEARRPFGLLSSVRWKDDGFDHSGGKDAKAVSHATIWNTMLSDKGNSQKTNIVWFY